MADTARTTAQKAATTRKTQATKRSTAAKKGAGTRAAAHGATARSTAASNVKSTAARQRTAAAKKAADTQQELRTPIERAGELAETAVYVPVGVALAARDSVAATIDDLRSTYSTRLKARNQLRRYERRGSTAVRRLERDVKQARASIERELRDRRASIERELRDRRASIENELRDRRASIGNELKTFADDLDRRVDPVRKNVDLVGARVENVFQEGRTAATQASTRVQERFAALTE